MKNKQLVLNYNFVVTHKKNRYEIEAVTTLSSIWVSFSAAQLLHVLLAFVVPELPRTPWQGACIRNNQFTYQVRTPPTKVIYIEKDNKTKIRTVYNEVLFTIRRSDVYSGNSTLNMLQLDNAGITLEEAKELLIFIHTEENKE